MPFRATDRSAKVVRRARTNLAGLVCLAAVLVGCSQDNGGTAVPSRHSDPAEPVPGIAPTRQMRIPADAVVCAVAPMGDGLAIQAVVSDPAAPRITISVPQGWQSTPGSGDIALSLNGPDTLAATVRITETDLTPESAFLRYTAAVGGTMQRRKFSVMAAPFCGFSSQQLTGTLQGGDGGIDFADRITHIWTNTKQYLVAIHLQAHAGAPDFTSAKGTLTQDFTIVIP